MGQPAQSPATNDRLIIDGDRWQATLDGSLLDLTRREFSVLQALASRPGRVFSRDQLLALAFPGDTEVFDRTVDSHIRNIRRKIASVSTWDPIRSVYGVGYAYDG
jgi:two-component system response regulator BaeR